MNILVTNDDGVLAPGLALLADVCREVGTVTVVAPDREQINFGFDNNYEYKLYGHFSDDTVYEPASNGVYPEFVLTGYELISTNPSPIFKSQFSGSRADQYQIEKPE